MTEEQLADILKKAQKGDSQAFALIYDHFSPRIYKFIYFRVGHKEVAEDVLSDTFVKGWQKIQHVNSPTALSAWLYQIAKNNIIDYYRIKKETIALDDVQDFLPDEVNPIDDTNLNFDQKRILAVMKELPQEQQEVIKYKFFEDLSNEEIAYVMNKSEGAIRVIQHRAISKLKELVNKHEHE
ncbi:MAG: RNA polymerase sigma factor [Candidatus Doudnabacteria bacterium]|nr:RNA polymerase sigma factor [Candidatus Doudnabacteria bacterium]